MRPSGSSAPASRPFATMMKSGEKRSSAGTTTRSKAATYAPRPPPRGSGTLMLAPAPAPSPFSSTAPEKSGKQPSWCSEIVSTLGSS